jgi:hypothetical protein
MASLLKGVTFITGAGSGIGQYAAYALARHGVRQLALCDIRPDVLKTTSEELKNRYKDVEVLNIEMDTSKEDSVNSAVEQTVKQFGRLDIALNNAGIGGAQKQTPDQELKDWQRVMDINVNGVWLCQRVSHNCLPLSDPSFDMLRITTGPDPTDAQAGTIDACSTREQRCHRQHSVHAWTSCFLTSLRSLCIYHKQTRCAIQDTCFSRKVTLTIVICFKL